MGKSLIIQGADFSSNGFKYTEVIKTVTDLYNYQNVKIEDWSVQMATALNGIYYAEQANGVLFKGTSLTGAASTLKIDVEDYQTAIVYTQCDIAGPTIIGGAVMFFLDANSVVIGGYSTAPVGSTQGRATGVGSLTAWTTLSKDIPSNCKYIVCTFRTVSSPSTAFANFKLKLKKYLL